MDSLTAEVSNVYEKYWKSLNEPQIDGNSEEIIRLEINHFLLPFRKIYRINSSKGKINFTSRILQSNNNPKKPEYTQISKFEKELSQKQWNELKMILSDNCFWTTPILENKDVLDGVSYMLEVNNPENNICTNRAYHVVLRSMPESKNLNIIYSEIFKHDPISDLEVMQEEYLDLNYPPKNK